MKVLVACDSFKASLDAISVCNAISIGLKRQNIVSQVMPLADGGEGTAQVITQNLGGTFIPVNSFDPLGRPIKSSFGYMASSQTAIIDMASCSGIQLLNKKELNPLKTSSYGTGVLIKASMQHGAQRIILGIGGSATNDGGIGMAEALGYNFLDADGNKLPSIGASLIQIEQINKPKIVFPDIDVLCDVENPLFGPMGAAYVYAAQKGADQFMIETLDKGLRNFARFYPAQYAKEKGVGAAGGQGFGSIVFLNATLKSGIETILDLLEFDDAIKDVDLVITGEGKIDAQTKFGKLIQGICQRAKKYNKPVIAFCGQLHANKDDLKAIGLKNAYPIMTNEITESYAMTHTSSLLTTLASKINFDTLVSG